MVTVAVISALGYDPEDETQFVHGKHPVEWCLIQARCSRWINIIHVVAETEAWQPVVEQCGGKLVKKRDVLRPDAIDVECLMEGVAACDPATEVHLAVYLSPRFPARAVNDVDDFIDFFRLQPMKPRASGTRLEDSSVFAVDTQRLMTEYVKDGLLRSKEEMDAIEIVRHVGPVNDPAHHAAAEILKSGPGQYQAYLENVLSETGYRQNAALYNKGVEHNLLPIDYSNSFTNHITVHLEVGLPGDDDVEEYALIKRIKGNDKAHFVKRWRAHSARDVLKDKVENRGPAIIIGSGQSLDDALPLLKNWKGATFCSTSHASSMIYHGCDPTYIVAYDIASYPDELTISDAWAKHKSTLITHPGVNPDLMQFWEGDKLLFREMDTSNYFMSKILPVAYGHFIQTIMYLFSCSVAAELSLAQAMGYSPLFLVGCDFTAGRFTKTKWVTSKIQSLHSGWMTEETTPVVGGFGAKMIRAENGEWSYPMTVFYKRSVLCVWNIDRSQCLMTSPKSIITQMPQVDIQQVIEQQGRGFESQYLTPSEIEDRSEEYLAKVGQFLVRVGNGKRVVETGDQDWEKSVETYMQGLQNALVQQGQLTDTIDIEWNMNRFRAMKERSGWKRAT